MLDGESEVLIIVNLIKSIRSQIAIDTVLTIIRADQKGPIPALPYATYKVIGDRKGFGRYTTDYLDAENTLMETHDQTRNATISFNVYGTSQDNAFEVAQQLRKWFDWRGSLFLEEINVALVSTEEVSNRTIFLTDSYDERWGFDVIIRYQDSDELEIDYFDKVESEIIIERE